jgi:hypothetical protein
MPAARRVDQNALRTHQAILIIVLLLAYIADLHLLVAFAAAVMIIGALYPPARLFVLVYRHILRRTGLIQPEIITDNPEPHRFAMAVGAIFLTASTIALYSDVTGVGWALMFIVVVLAAINLFLGFCVGCFVYYQLNKLGVPGFEYAPIQ